MDQRQLLHLALESLERQRAQLEAEIGEIVAQLERPSAIRPAGTPRRRTAAEKKAQSEKMKQIWAKRRGATAEETAPSKAARKPMSAAARKAVSEKLKAAWAKRKKDETKATAKAISKARQK